jgi:hypothetical protein
MLRGKTTTGVDQGVSGYEIKFKTLKLFKPFKPPSLSSPASRGKMKKGD